MKNFTLLIVLLFLGASCGDSANSNKANIAGTYIHTSNENTETWTLNHIEKDQYGLKFKYRNKEQYLKTTFDPTAKVLTADMTGQSMQFSDDFSNFYIMSAPELIYYKQ